MTWLRWEADSAFTDVVDELAATLKIPAAHAYGLYVATCNGFGRFRKDGNVAAVLDSALEDWARWKGRPGRWAAAFRDRCADESGILRGWWRNAAVLRKQEKDASRPPSNQRGNRGGIAGESGGIPRGNLAGDGGRRTDTGTELPLPSNLPPRLAQRLIGEPGRFAIWDFLEAVPPDQQYQTWTGCLLGCLDGLGLDQGRPATVGELAAACADYRPAQWGIPHFRSFVDRTVAKRFRPEKKYRGRESRTERAVQAVKEFVAEGES